MRSCLATVGSRWAGSNRTRSPTATSRPVKVTCSSDTIQTSAPGSVGVAVVHPEGLQPGVGDRPASGADGDHGRLDADGDLERERAVANAVSIST